MTQSVALKRTPLHAVHVSMGARMVDFGGWYMPVQYSGVVEEHHTVRKAVGLFDVGHMGEIEIRGPEAVRLVEYVTSNAASKLQINQLWCTCSRNTQSYGYRRIWPAVCQSVCFCDIPLCDLPSAHDQV